MPRAISALSTPALALTPDREADLPPPHSTHNKKKSGAGATLTIGVEAGSKWFMISHGKKVARLHRPADQRKALLRNLTTDLLRYGRITTTMARAKAMRKPVEHMIQLGKDGGEHKKRQAMAYIFDNDLTEALFEAAPERYADRNGGYTRIVRTLRRRGDNAEMAIIELV